MCDLQTLFSSRILVVVRLLSQWGETGGFFNHLNELLPNPLEQHFHSFLLFNDTTKEHGAGHEHPIC